MVEKPQEGFPLEIVHSWMGNRLSISMAVYKEALKTGW